MFWACSKASRKCSINKGLGEKGKLTDALIDRLQNYYDIAIRSNVGNLEAMKKAIQASLNHCIASKRRNLHMLCPDGADSWCRPGLPDNIIKLVKPIYERSHKYRAFISNLNLNAIFLKMGNLANAAYFRLHMYDRF